MAPRNMRIWGRTLIWRLTLIAFEAVPADTLRPLHTQARGTSRPWSRQAARFDIVSMFGVVGGGQGDPAAFSGI